MYSLGPGGSISLNLRGVTGATALLSDGDACDTSLCPLVWSLWARCWKSPGRGSRLGTIATPHHIADEVLCQRLGRLPEKLCIMRPEFLVFGS